MRLREIDGLLCNSIIFLPILIYFIPVGRVSAARRVILWPTDLQTTDSAAHPIVRRRNSAQELSFA